jgi:hypothetical protein
MKQHLNMKFSWVLAGMSIIAGGISMDVVRADPPPTAQALWQKVTDAYKNAATFSSEGQYEVDMQTATAFKQAGTFKILYARPGQIRVDWTDTQFGGDVVASSVFTQDNTIYFLMGITKKWSAQKDMEMALGTAAGVSHSISYAIPSLLRGGASYLSFTTLQPVTPGTVNGRDCLVLTGADRMQQQRVVSVDPVSDAILQIKTTQLIRTGDIAGEIAKAKADLAKTDPAAAAKMVAPPPMPDFTTVQTTTFTDPIFGANLKPADFVYPVPSDAVKVDNVLK